MTRRQPPVTRSLIHTLGLAGTLGIGLLMGCNGTDAPVESAADLAEAQRVAALNACGMDDGTVEHSAEIHACAPGDAKKTTICHIPPGNPSNAHTLCVGNAAVPAHLHNHGDYLGACKEEKPCPPPPAADGGPGGGEGPGEHGSTGAAGANGGGGDDGQHPSDNPPTGAAGTSGGGAAGQTGGAAGAGGSSLIIG